MNRVKKATPSAGVSSGVVLSLVLTLLTFLPAGASAAAPDTLWNACGEGFEAGRCFGPVGVAADPTTGHLYVAESSGGERIKEFDAWGVFVQSWGWGVRDGASELQTCTAQTGCQTGVGGNGDGQFDQPFGVAIDSAGNVYVVDGDNHRVQKFDPDGGPGGEAKLLLSFGGEVNRTKSEEVGSTESQRNLCLAGSSDVCQAGTAGAGAGQFATWPVGSYIAVGENDHVYVGDVDRIQVFNSGGEYLESIPLPGERVAALAIDASEGPNKGDLYVALCNPSSGCSQGFVVPGSKPDVLRLDPTGAAQGTLSVANPRALAVDGEGNVYVVDGVKLEGASELRIHKFDEAGVELPGHPFTDDLDKSYGIATSSACGIPGGDLYVANVGVEGKTAFIRAYGPPPDPDLCPQPVVPPRITAQYATAVQSTGATVKAEIAPEFWPDTTYYVQYGTGRCSEGGCGEERPVAPGSKLTDQVTNRVITTAGVFLDGLQPGSTYHYRFVAQSSGGGPVFGAGGEVGVDGAEGSFTTYPVASPPKSDCPNQAFRVEASAKLPDCRAYEMVSPVDKNGGDVSSGEISKGFTAPNESSADGERVAFSSLRPFANPSSGLLTNQYLASRGPSGWSTAAISPPRSNPPSWPTAFTGQFKAFDEDLCSGWLVPDSFLPLVPGAPEGTVNIYRRDYCQSGSEYELLTTLEPPGYGFGPGERNPQLYVPNPQGFSSDQDNTVFRAAGALTPEACQTVGIYQVYLSSKDGPLRLISALPNGKATCTNSTAGTFEDSTPGFRESNMVGAISEDGSKVFWTDSLDNSLEFFQGTGPGNLYLRRNATEEPSEVVGGQCTEEEKACTVAISKSGKARFWGADPQGTTAIYGVAGAGVEELFEYDVEEAKSRLIAKGFQGVAGISEDTSRVYFVSTEALTGEQANSEGDQAQAGKPNLYLYQRGVGYVFVAGVSSRDARASANVKPNLRTSRVSPDGLHLAFASEARITDDYDNTDVSGGGPAAEVYLYDATGDGGTGELRCVSCNPSGARPRGREFKITAGDVSHVWSAATIPGWSEQLRPTRLLAEDGSHLFFESYDDLLPRDSNGKVDVYEWVRASGAGACEEAGADLYVESSGGCLSMISSGQSPEDSELLDASKSGRDVFFTTAASLLPQDPGLVDVYDARTGGGYPPPQEPPAICEGEACQGPASVPDDPTPASAAFSGVGNVKRGSSPRCPKGKRRARKGGKGRCVPSEPHKASGHRRANHKRRAGR